MPIYTVNTLPADRFPLVQFVSAPEVGATVRFDFNSAGIWADEDVWPEHDGFSLGVPELQGDPDGIGVDPGLRELGFNFVVKGSDTAATQVMSALARELLRPTNWLLFYKSAEAAPVWFKTYRTQPGDMDFEHVYNERNDQWYGIGVSLFAEPYARGTEVALPSVTLNNYPITENPMFYTLPDVIGDAPAPLRIRAKATTPANRMGATSFLYVGRAAFSTGGASAVEPDTTSIDGTTLQTTFATTPGMTQRAGFLLGETPHGRYKVLLRVRATAGDTVLTLGLRADTLGAKTVTLGTSWQYVDLGETSIPTGTAHIVDDFLPSASTAGVGLFAARLSGTGALEFQHAALMFLLDDGETSASCAFVRHGVSDAVVDATYIDTATESVRLVTSGDVPTRTSESSSLHAGGFPTAEPGYPNVLVYLPTFAPPAGGSDSTTESTALAVSYQPQYLYLAGA